MLEVRPTQKMPYGTFPMITSAVRERPDAKAVQVVQIFANANLGCMLNGLSKLCAQYNVSIEDRDVGSLIVFINSAQSYIKIIACNGSKYPLIVAYRLPSGSTIGGLTGLVSILQGVVWTLRSAARVDLATALRDSVVRYLGDERKS